MSPSQPHEDWKPSHNPYLIAITVTLATFMEVLDSSIANVALPHMAGSLGASYDEATWVLTSYLVSSAIVLPVSGWLSTVIGRKRFYMSCVVLFTACSFLCGIAPSLPFLIVARILQGAGGGGLQPSEQAILADTFPAAKRGMAFALYGMAVVVAPAIVPRSAAGSPTISTGTGSSSSISPSGRSRCFLPAAWWKILRGSGETSNRVFVSITSGLR